MTDSKAQKKAIDAAQDALYSAQDSHDETREILTKFYEDAFQAGVIYADMVRLSWSISSHIGVVGAKVVAERLDISVEELAKRVHPDTFGDLTMSELRYLCIAAEVVMDYEVISKPKPISDEG